MTQPLSDKKRFPITTQDGLSEANQALIDSINLDAMREHIDNDVELDEEDRARFAELEIKHRIRMRGVVIHPPPADPPEPPPPPPEPKPDWEPAGDPRYAMTPEQRARAAAGHREMMSFPPSEPIDGRKSNKSPSE